MKTILVVGGDGFCGWPLSLRLSSIGYNVVIVDNLSRRKIDVELGTESLTPIRTIYERLQAWHEVSNRTITFHLLNVASEYDRFVQIVREYRVSCCRRRPGSRVATRSVSRFVEWTVPHS